MEKIRAKLRAFGRIRDGVLIKMARRRALIGWTSSTGRTRETWAVPVATEAELEGEAGFGKCWLAKPVASVKASPRLVTDPDAIQQRKATVIEYPEGSLREQRQQLLKAEREVRALLADCEHCNSLRSEANRLVNEAERIFAQCIEEKQNELDAPRIKRVIYQKEQHDNE